VIRTESVDDTIKLAIHACEQRGFTLTSGNLEKCGLARSTFSKHKEAVQNWMRILTT
jgi:ACT domain-containing protein